MRHLAILWAATRRRAVVNVQDETGARELTQRRVSRRTSAATTAAQAWSRPSLHAW